MAPRMSKVTFIASAGVVGRSIQVIWNVLSNVYLYLDILIVITYHINCVSIHKDTFIHHFEFYAPRTRI